MPWLIGKVPRGTGDTDRSKLLNNLVQMVQDAVAVINDDESIDALEFQSKSASADIYERLISASNREISKAILGQTLSTELDNKGGSRAAAQAHLEVREDIVEKDKRTVKTTMNQMLGWLAELNVPNALPPEFYLVRRRRRPAGPRPAGYGADQPGREVYRRILQPGLQPRG